MEYRTLGNDLTVSAVGLGCMGMSHAYGASANKKEMTELLAQAVDMGYTFFDTAEVYGTPDNPHDNEELVGAALKPYRDKIVLATKFGIHFDMTSTAVNKPLVPDSRPEVIRASVDASLKRLDTDHIDLYYQHRLDPKVPIEEVAGVMADLIREGKITSLGPFGSHRGDHPPSTRSLPGNGHPEPLLHDGPLVRKPVPGSGRTAHWLCGILAACKRFSLRQIR